MKQSQATFSMARCEKANAAVIFLHQYKLLLANSIFARMYQKEMEYKT